MENNRAAKWVVRFTWSGAKTDWFDSKSDAQRWVKAHKIEGGYVIERCI